MLQRGNDLSISAEFVDAETQPRNVEQAVPVEARRHSQSSAEITRTLLKT